MGILVCRAFLIQERKNFVTQLYLLGLMTIKFYLFFAISKPIV